MGKPPSLTLCQLAIAGAGARVSPSLEKTTPAPFAPTPPSPTLTCTPTPTTKSGQGTPKGTPNPSVWKEMEMPEGSALTKAPRSRRQHLRRRQGYTDVYLEWQHMRGRIWGTLSKVTVVVFFGLRRSAHTNVIVFQNALPSPATKKDAHAISRTGAWIVRSLLAVSPTTTRGTSLARSQQQRLRRPRPPRSPTTTRKVHAPASVILSLEYIGRDQPPSRTLCQLATPRARHSGPARVSPSIGATTPAPLALTPSSPGTTATSTRRMGCPAVVCEEITAPISSVSLLTKTHRPWHLRRHLRRHHLRRHLLRRHLRWGTARYPEWR
mmetsp:Transcript_89284/g.253010  ORF Transcript_89284/g.253010 Transcript_89284/m.253010 type:complete len:324 (+) Transcript_89284:101-1072(+)